MEYGIIALTGVLKSDVATKMSVEKQGGEPRAKCGGRLIREHSSFTLINFHITKNAKKYTK